MENSEFVRRGKAAVNAAWNSAVGKARPASSEKDMVEKSRKSAATRLVELAEAAGIVL